MNLNNKRRSIIEIIIVLVVVSGGLYYYLSKQTEVPEIIEKPVEEKEKISAPPKEELSKEKVSAEEKLAPEPIVKKCADGTSDNQCSVNKPKYCENGNLIDKCGICGCNLNQSCNLNESCGASKTQVNIMAYIQTGISGIDETSYRNFIENINKLYSNNGLNVRFNVGSIMKYSQGQSCGTNFYGNDVIMCVGPGKGGYLGSPYYIVGANTNDPFGFSPTGIRAEAHELAHYLGFQDLYWLRSQESLKTPTNSEIENDLMTDPYNAENVFGEHAKYVLNYNFELFKAGGSNSILYPRSRMASKLRISTGMPNQSCQIYTRERDYVQFNSKINATLALTKITDSSGDFQMDIIAGDQADNNFDIYYLECNGNNFWINSLMTEDCFKQQGTKEGVCNIRCLDPSNYCQFY